MGQPKIDWYGIVEDQTICGLSLTEARVNRLKYYKNECSKHGVLAFRVLDNSCPFCCAEAHAKRKTTNKTFNQLRELLHQRKRIAKQRQIEFTITTTDIRELVPTICPVLGIPLTFEGVLDTSPSIDRLDCSKGYTRENVRIISTRANRLKNNGTAEEHRLIYEWMKREGL